MKINSIICFLLMVISITVRGQKKEIEINRIPILFKQAEINILDGAEIKTVEVYRGSKKLLTHTIFKEGGDCSSIQIQLGKYQIKDNKIIFYSYWAAADRMPGSILPFGFRKQQYTVDDSGIIRLLDSKIYLENIVTTENKNFFENNGWKHKGLKFLNISTKNEYDQRLLMDYIKNVENEYNAQFVFDGEKKDLEKEVRNILKSEIKKYTENWVEGETYGRVKK